MDRDTGRAWCLRCASDLIHTGDPILCFYGAGALAYEVELCSRRIGRRFATAAD
ncbi:hypothetical protein [Streptacidiphilus sp. MAP12-20]|uniref:hypothetical protein n=1 Tax=Streptacidiphilus sp. MAP12-20 TaxID=3156299 RepID=UPI003513002F